MNKKVNKSRLMLKINAGLLKVLTDDELRLIKTPAFALLFDKKYPNAPLSIEECQKLGLIVYDRSLLSMMMVPSSLFMTYFNSLDKSVQHELCKKEIYKEHFINYATLMVNTSFEKDFINFVNQHQITIEIKCLFIYLYKQLKNKIPKSLKLVKNSELF